MTFQQIPQCVEVALHGSVNGVPYVNRWYVDTSHTVTETDLDDIAAVFDDWVTSDLANAQSVALLYDHFTVKNMDVENGLQKTYPVTTPDGAVNTASTANNAACVVSLRTALSGRSYRGRTYIGSIPVGQIADATHVSSTFADGLVDIFENLIDALTTAGYILVVVSKVSLGIQRVTAAVTAVTTIIVNTIIDSQRRRTAN